MNMTKIVFSFALHSINYFFKYQLSPMIKLSLEMEDSD